MPTASMGIEVLSEPFLIPVWFYGYSAIVYAASALISFFIMFLSYKFFRMSSSKTSMLFTFSFLFLTIAFSVLTFASTYTYLYKPYFKDSLNLGSLGFVNSIGFNTYYIVSIIAYFSILMVYLPKDVKKLFKNKLPILYVPLWYLNLESFHIVSILILLYVAIKTSVNFYKKHNTENFLTMLAFVSIIIFHTFLLFTTFDPTIYLAANSLLALGFGSFLLTLIRVSRSDRKKK